MSAPSAAPAPRWYAITVYGFDGDPFPPIVDRPTKSAARYAGFLAIQAAGYFAGSDGFARYLREVRVRRATDAEITNSPRIEQ